MSWNTRRNILQGIAALVLSFLVPAIGWTQTAFEKQLPAVFRLWNAEKATELALVLQRLGNGGVIEDVRLFLLAECLKRAGHDAEASDLYGRLMKQYPDSIGARRAGLPYILMMTKNGVSPESLVLLKQLALALPTAYQRGRALEGLAQALPPGHREKGELALLSLRAYREPSGSLAPAKDAVNLLKSLIENHGQWSLTPEEWVEICLAATAEGLGQSVLKLGAFLKPTLGPHGAGYQLLIQADALRMLGQRDRALSLLES
ncbi:MAG TPA: tetratricopeptide repeat protein, partial [Candidatus Ozemobacteraceae bacterium]|nr:tetratricopeptide repeat protein [Candidatus Ozemobacteraceae bacterium]